MIPKLDEYKERWGIMSDDSIKPGLKAIQQALVAVGHPEKKGRIIHVAGTNGKGSTIAFMEAILKERGFSTGVFSSPALIDIHDQIRINGEPITKAELNESFRTMKEAGLSGLLTNFELLTVAAFLTFERLQPDYVLLETGMGGKSDSTNVVMPIVSVITSIALDHTAFLGDTITQVAEQKAGIIKEGVPVVIGPLPTEAQAVVRQVANGKESPLYIYGEHFKMEGNRFISAETIQLEERKMKGEHQGVNAAVAIESLRVAGIQLKQRAVQQAIATVQLAHRFEEIAPGVFVDGAHNPAAANRLAETIRSEFPGEKVDFVIGMLKGKDIEQTLNELIPVASSFTFVSFSHAGAASGEELMGYCQHKVKEVVNGINEAKLLDASNDRKKIVTGSLYLLSGIRDYLKG
ncbi:bifunctional folylpolyglutamate synthase/dihydrofolate synthase [Sporosarcina sp. ACRSM]|uniref:bifunctional folylpolyglutamate synthase/dihydrofolate synthase n=1 Tax=Sporosarcina sp. ACRSM TaxID=2918216 RepID=UPI001EF53151|nr:folylpolyglutamate synthase/dihydrofolate synthase family protein [Sporosarcina sp. ACRSM]MCG7336993.1 bifunctional folylpolyglutamate synthase/dihydrofolate synthase [Sporosarcina sp. ACRSM]